MVFYIVYTFCIGDNYTLISSKILAMEIETHVLLNMESYNQLHNHLSIIV